MGEVKRVRRRLVSVQRRLWLAQVLMWPTIVAAGAVAAVGVVWFLRRRSEAGRHEMPDLPGAHEEGSVHVEPDGHLTRP